MALDADCYIDLDGAVLGTPCTPKGTLAWNGSLIFSAVVVMAVVSVTVFVPTDQVPTEIHVLIAGLVAGADTTRFGFPHRWMGAVVLHLFVVIWFLPEDVRIQVERLRE